MILLIAINSIYAQENKLYQKGITAEQNLKDVIGLTPYSTGGMGFDTRYEGIKGSPRIYDTLLSSYLKINGKEEYLKLATDIDAVSNTLLFNHPKTGKLLGIPASMVSEVVINKDGKDLIYRTDEGRKFDKSVKDNKFFQVLLEIPYLFIKMPVKTFTEADYKGAYSSDRRYDEYETIYRYYILTSNGTYHKIQLSKKSLVKLFPSKKDLINNFPVDGSYANDEEMIKAIIGKL